MQMGQHLCANDLARNRGTPLRSFKRCTQRLAAKQVAEASPDPFLLCGPILVVIHSLWR